MATVYNMYIFNKSGVCLFYKEWHRPRSTLKESPEEDEKLMFGLLFSLTHQVIKPLGGKKSFHTVKCRDFCLNHFQSATGYRFVINTSVAAKDMQSKLLFVYENLFVPLVVRNPLWKPGIRIKLDAFERGLQESVESW